jgi:methyl-accepting chemotaxis protein
MDIFNHIIKFGRTILNHPRIANSRIVSIGLAAARHPSVSGDAFITRNFKLQFILKFCLVAVLGGAIFTGLIIYYCRGTLTTTFVDGRLLMEETSLTVLPGVIYTNLFMLVLSFIVTVVIIFFLSYRLRKPLFRFQNDIQTVAQGDLTTMIRYRGQDRTMALAKDINHMTANLNKKVGEVEAGFRQVINASASEDVPDELGIALIRVHRSIGRSFKLSPKP